MDEKAHGMHAEAKRGCARARFGLLCCWKCEAKARSAASVHFNLTGTTAPAAVHEIQAGGVGTASAGGSWVKPGHEGTASRSGRVGPALVAALWVRGHFRTFLGRSFVWIEVFYNDWVATWPITAGSL